MKTCKKCKKVTDNYVQIKVMNEDNMILDKAIVCTLCYTSWIYKPLNEVMS